MADDKPIIVVKKKGGHAGHHGGAWKVAYADFITAMMAFFLTMWLVNTADTATKKNIAKYFRQPGLFSQGSGSPLMTGESGILDSAFVPERTRKERDYMGKGEDPNAPKEDSALAPQPSPVKPTPGKKTRQIKPSTVEAGPGPGGPAVTTAALKGEKGAKAALAERQKLSEVAKEIQRQVAMTPQLKEALGNLDVKFDPDGMIIEIMDTAKSSMFMVGGTTVTPAGREAFARVAKLLQPLQNKIDVIGHTDARPFAAGRGYGNWELSADRANEARRLLETVGIPATQIAGVMGRADRDLRNTTDPTSLENRRITLKVRFGPDAPAVPGEPAAQALGGKSASGSPSGGTAPSSTGGKDAAPGQEARPPATTPTDSGPAAAGSTGKPEDSTGPGKDEAEPAPEPTPGANGKIAAPWKKMGSRKETVRIPDQTLKENPAPADGMVFKNRPVLGPNEPILDY